MRIVATWYGTVALHLVVEDELGVFLDPFFERPENAFPRVTARAETVDLDPLDAIFVSHSHFDHIFNLPNLIRRYPSAHAYVPATTAENCQNLCNGAIFKDYSCRLFEGDWERICTITAGDHVELSSRNGSVQLRAMAIKSKHVKFDTYSILRVLINWRLWRRFRYYFRLMAGFPIKEVVGWELQFRTSTECKRVVYFGSLCKEYPQILSRHSDCDYLVVPLAGRRNILPHASVITESLRPKAVIPVHYDDFFPPISYLTDYKNYEEWLAKALPSTGLITLQTEQPTPI